MKIIIGWLSQSLSQSYHNYRNFTCILKIHYLTQLQFAEYKKVYVNHQVTYSLQAVPLVFWRICRSGQFHHLQLFHNNYNVLLTKDNLLEFFNSLSHISIFLRLVPINLLIFSGEKLTCSLIFSKSTTMFLVCRFFPSIYCCLMK